MPSCAETVSYRQERAEMTRIIELRKGALEASEIVPPSLYLDQSPLCENSLTVSISRSNLNVFGAFRFMLFTEW